MSKVSEIVTGQILEQLEQGVVPWSRPWKVGGLAPANLATGRAHRGINLLLLGFRAGSTPWWLTFRQAKALGGAGAPGCEVGVGRVLETGREAERRRGDGGRVDRRADSGPSQLPRFQPRPDGRDRRGSHSLALDRGSLAGGGSRGDRGSRLPRPSESRASGAAPGLLRPASDTVTMPPRKVLESSIGYHSTLFHELAHSTGHVRRLGRPSFERNHTAPFGSDEYAREELVAELVAAYLDHWRQKLSRDPRLIVTAAQQAQKAADHILGRNGKEVDAVS